MHIYVMNVQIYSLLTIIKITYYVLCMFVKSLFFEEEKNEKFCNIKNTFKSAVLNEY